MIVKPVYLLEPEPDRGPSRRRFLAASIGCLLGGAALGGVAGFGIGRSSTGGESPIGADDDADRRKLTWALDLAAGPIDRLYAEFNGFMVVIDQHPDEPRLWDAAERLARHVLESTAPSDSWQVATRLAHLMKRYADASSSQLRQLAAKLTLFAEQR